MGPCAPFITKEDMNKRQQAQQASIWRRTEQTRNYTREFSFELFIHENAQRVFETRIEIKHVETAIPTLDKYVVGVAYNYPPYISGDQFLIPPETDPVDFILQFCRNGQYPDIDPVPPVKIKDGIMNVFNEIGIFTFKYQVNEYLERQSPGARFPWQGRFTCTGKHVSTDLWKWRDPKTMKQWLKRSGAFKCLAEHLQILEDIQARQALKKLMAA